MAVVNTYFRERGETQDNLQEWPQMHTVEWRHVQEVSSEDSCRLRLIKKKTAKVVRETGMKALGVTSGQ